MQDDNLPNALESSFLSTSPLRSPDRMAPVRSAAIHESALSPQEYDEYATLVDAFEASFASTARLPPPEVWQWLLQWLGQVDTRTEKEVSYFTGLHGSMTMKRVNGARVRSSAFVSATLP